MTLQCCVAACPRDQPLPLPPRRPPVLLAKGSEVPLTAGAPLALDGPQLPGYDMLPGRLPFDYGSYDCPESEM